MTLPATAPARTDAPIMAQNRIDVNMFYLLCFQGERRWCKVGVGRWMKKRRRSVLSRAASTAADNRAHVAHVAPERTGWTVWRPPTASGQGRARVRSHPRRSVPIVPINRVLTRARACCLSDRRHSQKHQDIVYIGTYS